MATITKKEIIDRIANQIQCKNVIVKEIVQQFLNDITAELAKRNRIEFRDFGVFEVKERAARTAQNPKTLEKIQIPAKRGVKFKMGRVMRERMNDHPTE